MKYKFFEEMWKSEVRWPNSGDFWYGKYRILYLGNGDGSGEVGFI